MAGDDIVKSGVKIVTPDPGSSGAARWNVLEANAHGLANGGASGGEAFAQKFLDDIVGPPASGREATSTFTAGTGDVLISHENEAILARVAPRSTASCPPTDSSSRTWSRSPRPRRRPPRPSWPTF